MQSSPASGFERTWYSNIELAEIYDLQWAPDSSYIIAGAINSKVLYVYYVCLNLIVNFYGSYRLKSLERTRQARRQLHSQVILLTYKE